MIYFFLGCFGVHISLAHILHLYIILVFKKLYFGFEAWYLTLNLNLLWNLTLNFELQLGFGIELGIGFETWIFVLVNLVGNSFRTLIWNFYLEIDFELNLKFKI
jgi:hypothetical protein